MVGAVLHDVAASVSPVGVCSAGDQMGSAVGSAVVAGYVGAEGRDEAVAAWRSVSAADVYRRLAVAVAGACGAC